MYGAGRSSQYCSCLLQQAKQHIDTFWEASTLVHVGLQSDCFAQNWNNSGAQVRVAWWDCRGPLATAASTTGTSRCGGSQNELAAAHHGLRTSQELVATKDVVIDALTSHQERLERPSKPVAKPARKVAETSLSPQVPASIAPGEVKASKGGPVETRIYLLLPGRVGHRLRKPFQPFLLGGNYRPYKGVDHDVLGSDQLLAGF